jgi:preprotein translocase subunit SecA
MDLQQSWDLVSDFFGGFSRGLEKAITSLFGSANARYLKKLQTQIDAINALEPKYQQMTSEELAEQTVIFRRRLAAGETLEDLLNEAFAVCREAGRRVLGMRHYDVQLVGGIVLHGGNIAEMVTGEGKTLVATLPTYLNALAGSVHVVTVNDYLARRDMEWMGPLHMSLGLTIGAIQSNMPEEERQAAYACDITYGTNNEFGFDYLRDNMRQAALGDDRYPKHLQQVQGPLTFAVVDEVDNILIDEARTPLIISGPAHDDVTRYAKAERIARQLKRDVHFEVNEKEHSAHLTDEGIRAAEKLAGVESFYTAGNMEWPHLIDNSLRAHNLYKLDVNYVIKDGEIVIVDEFTGRLMPGRSWSDGLHQAVEAKEGVRIKEENQTLATITLQNYFKLYDNICGMTGTAMTEASEFYKIYGLDVIAIPTNCDLQRVNNADVILRTEKEKYTGVVDEIEEMHKFDLVELDNGRLAQGKILREHEDSIEFQEDQRKERQTVPLDRVKHIQRRGRPILVGTVSIEKSELISHMLERRGIKHEVLNAKHHQREAEIISQAGRKGAVTIATNMAGRGTDIILGGNPEAVAWAQLQEKYATRLDVPQDEWDTLVSKIEQQEQMKAEGRDVAELGGLYVIGTERHEARRIDLQLRGRCGRQGDPGSSRFFLSLEDDLMRIFAGEWVKNMLTRLGMKEGEAIQSRMVTRRIEGAQKKVEERNFEIRKSLLEYDEVMDEQRKRIYSYRQTILDGGDCKQLIMDMIDQQIEHYLGQFLDRDYGPETFASWTSNVLSAELDPRDYRRMSFEQAVDVAKDSAARIVQSQVFDAIEENLPEDGDTSDWNWDALAKMANVRWGLSLRGRDLKKEGADRVAEILIERGQAVIQDTDLSGGSHFLDTDFGLKSTCLWVRHKFGYEMVLEEIQDLEPLGIKQLISQKAREIYAEKEAEYPVMAGLYHFTVTEPGGRKRYDREQLVSWARDRFGVEFSLEDLRNKQREEIRESLLVHSLQSAKLGNDRLEKFYELLDAGFGPEDSEADEEPLWSDQVRERLEKLSNALAEDYKIEFPLDDMVNSDRTYLRRHLVGEFEDTYRSEMRKMERALVLQLLDTAWKDHLLSMDHLKSSIGLRSYAQVDPKVEYKREGMRTFEAMWKSIGERVTDLVFRMEQLDEQFVGSTWTESAAIHEEASSPTEIAQQQQAAINGTQDDHKQEPIRNRDHRVGRNDPCPCGSGKKFKACCMRK